MLDCHVMLSVNLLSSALSVHTICLALLFYMLILFLEYTHAHKCKWQLLFLADGLLAVHVLQKYVLVTYELGFQVQNRKPCLIPSNYSVP